MKTSLMIMAVAGLTAGAAPGAVVDHYWDMDTLSEGTPIDVVGGASTTAIDAGGESLLLNQAFGAAYAGAGNALQTNLGGTGSMHLAAAMGDLTVYGQFDWAISYWSYDDNTGDGDVRGPRVFDSLSGITEGFSLGSNASGIFNFRTDSVGGGSSISNNTLTTISPTQDAWTSVVINYTSTTDTIEVFFNGASQGTYSGNVTGAINHTQDLQIGTINGGANAADAQSSALDDLAFYTGTLSQAEITGLANGTITPLDIPEPGSLALMGLGGLLVARRRRD